MSCPPRYPSHLSQSGNHNCKVHSYHIQPSTLVLIRADTSRYRAVLQLDYYALFSVIMDAVDPPYDLW